MTTPPVRSCACCTRETSAWVCFACRIAHGKRVSKSCPVYARVEAEAASRVAALPTSKPVSVSKEMQQRMWGLDG